MQREGITREKLIEMIKNNEDVRFVNTSQITNFSRLFKDKTNFNQDISGWDVSSGTNFRHMFDGCKNFNQPLNNWNVSNGTDFRSMFYGCGNFNQPLNIWNVGNGTSFNSMFDGCENFNQTLNNWNVSNGTYFSYMFYGCKIFNQPLNNWNVSNGTDFRAMFEGCKNFNQSLNNWIKNSNHISTLLDGLNINYIQLNKENVLFIFKDLFTVRTVNKEFTPLIEYLKNNKLEFKTHKINKENELYQMFEMKYADKERVLNSPVFYGFNKELYDHKLNQIEEDLYIGEESFKNLIRTNNEICI